MSLLRIALVITALTFASVTASAQAAQCKGIAFLWSHVYHSNRLEVKKQCAAVTGVIVKSLREPDGDLHVRVKLDSQFTQLLNDANRSAQGGNLVVEPICDHDPTQTDAIASCTTFHSTIPHYPAGTHVVVVGSYVLDNEHGWMEIHPVIRITAMQ